MARKVKKQREKRMRQKRLLDEPQQSTIQDALQKRGIEHRKAEGLEKMAKDLKVEIGIPLKRETDLTKVITDLCGD